MLKVKNKERNLEVFLSFSTTIIYLHCVICNSNNVFKSSAMVFRQPLYVSERLVSNKNGIRLSGRWWTLLEGGEDFNIESFCFCFFVFVLICAFVKCFDRSSDFMLIRWDFCPGVGFLVAPLHTQHTGDLPGTTCVHMCVCVCVRACVRVSPSTCLNEATGWSLTSICVKYERDSGKGWLLGWSLLKISSETGLGWGARGQQHLDQSQLQVSQGNST